MGDSLVATRGRYGQLELSYLLRDRLGSVVGVETVRLTGRTPTAIVAETRHGFDAWGAPRSNRTWTAAGWREESGRWLTPSRTQQGFTGHERLSGLQLIHMRGRVFDPQLGRFHGVDPIIQFPLSSQGLNPYGYILNNPMAGVDPTGYAAAPPPDPADRVDQRSICFKSPGSCTQAGNGALVFGFTASRGNGAQPQQVAARPAATAAESILGVSERPTQCSAADPAGLGPQLSLAEHRPLSWGQSLIQSWQIGVERLPLLSEGGRSLYRFFGEDAIETVGQAIDGDYTGAAVAAVFATAKPLKVADKVTHGVVGAAGVSRTGSTFRTNFNHYEVLTEVPISGTTRLAHRASANQNFASQLSHDAQFRGIMDDLLHVDVLPHMQSGSRGRLRNPPGTEWHHPVDNSNVMQLLRCSEHRNPALQDTLHPGPNRQGGFGQHFGGN